MPSSDRRWPRCDAETSASAGRLTSSHALVQRSAHRSLLELLLAGTGKRALLQLDGAPAGASDAAGENVKEAGGRADSLAPLTNAERASRAPSSPTMPASYP